MSAVSWTWPNPRPEKAPHDYTGFAPHLRGRVRVNGRGWLYVEVTNGERVINRDGPFRSITEAFADVEARVHSARGAWMFSYGPKSVGR